MCLAQGPQRSDAGEALTRGPSVSSQVLYHWATVLLFKYSDVVFIMLINVIKPTINPFPIIKFYLYHVTSQTIGLLLVYEAVITYY